MHNVSNEVTRPQLVEKMEEYGEVIGCQMGQRGTDMPVVRFKHREGAERAMKALRNPPSYCPIRLVITNRIYPYPYPLGIIYSLLDVCP